MTATIDYPITLQGGEKAELTYTMKFDLKEYLEKGQWSNDVQNNVNIYDVDTDESKFDYPKTASPSVDMPALNKSSQLTESAEDDVIEWTLTVDLKTFKELVKPEDI